MKLTTIILFLTISSYCQSPNKTTVLAQGIVYNWQVIEADYANDKVTYFYWEFFNSNYGTKNSNGKQYGHINYLFQEDLQNLIDIFRMFGNLPTNTALCYTGPGYNIETTTKDNYIYMEDWQHSSIKISKTKARNLANEIEKSIGLIGL